MYSAIQMIQLECRGPPDYCSHDHAVIIATPVNITSLHYKGLIETTFLEGAELQDSPLVCNSLQTLPQAPLRASDYDVTRRAQRRQVFGLHLAPVVQSADNSIQRINRRDPADKMYSNQYILSAA